MRRPVVSQREGPCPRSRASATIRTRANGTWVIVKVDDRPARPLRDRLGQRPLPGRHGRRGDRAVARAAADRPRRRPHRGHLAVDATPAATGATARSATPRWPASTWRCGTSRAKRPGMPVYQLLGGAVPRGGALLRPRQRRHARGAGRRRPALPRGGLPVIRCQLGHYGGGGFIDRREAGVPPTNALAASTRVFDDELYLETIAAMFDHLRDKLGFGRQADPRRPRAPASRTTPSRSPSCSSRTGSSSWRTRCRRSRSPTTA